MLLAFWIGMCIFCVDRAVFHRARKYRWLWIIAFWVSMILCGLAKSWGIVNIAIIGGLVAFASAFAPGFRVLRRVEGFAIKLILALRLIVRRIYKSILLTGAWWGIPLMLAFFVLLFMAMLNVGGPEFRDTFKTEVTDRFMGRGSHTQSSDMRVPAILQLYYNTLPMSIFAGCAFFIIPLRKWLKFYSPIALPLWWIITVLIAFGIPRGFRPDYLMPCYPAIALLAAWVADNILKSQNTSRPAIRYLRRICFSVPFVLSAGLFITAGLYISKLVFPDAMSSVIKLPARMEIMQWYTMATIPTLAIIAIVMSILAIKHRSMHHIVIITCFCMLGVIFLYSHLWSRAARSGDGDTMIEFCSTIKPIVGEDKFMICYADKLGPEVYLGRMEAGVQKVEQLTAQGHPKWLIISDRGLVHLGAFKANENGPAVISQKGKKFRFVPTPHDLGTLKIRTELPIRFEYWGKLYLIELTDEINPSSKPIPDVYIEDEFH